MEDIDRLVIKNSLQEMFRRGHVSICDIDKCLKLAGITPDCKVHSRLSALHCVSFKDMDPELAQLIPGMVTELFTGMVLNVYDAPFYRRTDHEEPEVKTSHKIEEAKRKIPFLKVLGLN